MGSATLYVCILISGVLQSLGNVMNSQLRESLQNPWLASFVSFILIVPIFVFAFFLQPRPLPSANDLMNMPWYAPLGGVAGAFAVFAGLTLVSRVGAGAFVGLLITANLITSIVIDHFGWFNVAQHAASPTRLLGAAFLAVGVVLIAAFS